MNVLAAGVERLLIKRLIAGSPQLAFVRLSSASLWFGQGKIITIL
jgi:hypothetical protein